MTRFPGYRRKDGSVGVRDHLLVVSTVTCANEVAGRIARKVRGAVPALHRSGCTMLGADLRQFRRTLLGTATNPNVGAVVAIGLGCEQVDAREIASAAKASGRRAEAVVIQECGGSRQAVKRGVALGREVASGLARARRVSCPVSALVLATECGSSDFSSGLVANPVLGWVSDALVEAGATVVLSETTEIVGGEHLLAARAASRAVARKVREAVERVEERARLAGVDLREAQPTPGNVRGGLTTIEEKSLGCIAKAGSARLEGVVGYAERPGGAGLWFMDTPGQDVESVTGMAAGGAQVAVFTTGLGTPAGHPVVPVVKLTGNPETARTMSRHIDVSAGRVLLGGETVARAGERLLRFVLEVAGGRRTKAERHGHAEFGIYRIGPTM